MNFDNENILPNNGPTSAATFGRSINHTTLSPNKPLQKPTHHSKSAKSSSNTTVPPLRTKRKALGDITNKRVAISDVLSSKLSLSSKPSQFGKESNPLKLNAFSIHSDEPSSSLSLSSTKNKDMPSNRSLSNKNRVSKNVSYSNRIPKDTYGNVLSPENIPGAPSPPPFEEPSLFDSDEDVILRPVKSKASLQQQHQRRKRNSNTDIFAHHATNDFNSPIRKTNRSAFQPSSLMPPVFDDNQLSPLVSKPPPVNDENLFSRCDSPELELKYF